MKKITDFETIDHGVENAQSFQGCGVSHTDYDDCATGIGCSYREALEDALEQLASNGYEIPDELEAEVSRASAYDSVGAVLRDHYGDTKYVVSFGSHCGVDYARHEFETMEEARAFCADWIVTERRHGSRVTAGTVRCKKTGQIVAVRDKWEVETQSNREGAAVTDRDGILSLDTVHPEIPEDHELYYHVSVRVKCDNSDT